MHSHSVVNVISWQNINKTENYYRYIPFSEGRKETMAVIIYIVYISPFGWILGRHLGITENGGRFQRGRLDRVHPHIPTQSHLTNA